MLLLVDLIIEILKLFTTYLELLFDFLCPTLYMSLTLSHNFLGFSVPALAAKSVKVVCKSLGLTPNMNA